MNKETRIKTIDLCKRKNTIAVVLFVLLSVIGGFLIAFFGRGDSFVEESFTTCSLTLFGFDLTSVVFVYGVLQRYSTAESERIAVLLKKIASSIRLILVLILCSIASDFIASIFKDCYVINIVINCIKYSLLLYSLICQIDVINTFLILVKQRPHGSKE